MPLSLSIPLKMVIKVSLLCFVYVKRYVYRLLALSAHFPLRVDIALRIHLYTILLCVVAVVMLSVFSLSFLLLYQASCVCVSFSFFFSPFSLFIFTLLDGFENKKIENIREGKCDKQSTSQSATQLAILLWPTGAVKERKYE